MPVGVRAMARLPALTFLAAGMLVCADPAQADTPTNTHSDSTADNTVDTPAFDRPGIAFSVTTLPAGSLSWEQGLPDLSRDRSGGVTLTQYSAGSLIRVGLSPRLELQLGHAAFNMLRSKGNGDSFRQHGAGDTSVALKIAMPALAPDLQWALLGSTTLATGDAAFSNNHTAYALGATLEWSLDERHALAFYANAQTLDGDTTLTFSPSYSIGLNDTVGLFVEAGYTRARALPADVVGGGGVTWLISPRVQLDLSANVGLTSDSTDLQAGFGISVFFP